MTEKYFQIYEEGTDKIVGTFKYSEKQIQELCENINEGKELVKFPNHVNYKEISKQQYKVEIENLERIVEEAKRNRIYVEK